MIEIRRPGVATLADSLLGYDEIYSDHGIRLLDSFYLWLLSLLPIKDGARLLDVSCGEGSLVGFALRRGLDAFGLDISYQAARIAAQRTEQGRIVVGNGEILPFPDKYFDFVTNIGSLEHYFHPEHGMREIARVLKPEGRACILLPNSFGLTWNIYWVLHSGDIYIDDQPIQRYATRRQWEELLRESDLQVARVHGYDRPLPRTFSDLLWYIKRPRKLLAAMLSMGIPTNLAGSQVFICASGPSTNSTTVRGDKHEGNGSRLK